MRDGTYTDLHDFLRAEGEGVWKAWDANDLHTLATTWQTGDISKTSKVDALAQGDLVQVLSRIRAKALLMPSQTDVFFSVRVSRSPSSIDPNAPRVSAFGQRAGSAGDEGQWRQACRHTYGMGARW